MGDPGPGQHFLDTEALRAEQRRVRLVEWRLDLVRRAGPPGVPPLPPAQAQALTEEWRQHALAEREFWTEHADRLPRGSPDTVHTPTDFYWWLRGRVSALKLLHPELNGSPAPRPECPVPARWINDACALAERFRIPRRFVIPPDDARPQQVLSAFDALMQATDAEVERRGGGLPWRGRPALIAAAAHFDRSADEFDASSRRVAKASHLETDLQELASQAGRRLYATIDGGAWDGQWPFWGRSRKPGRDWFIYKDDFGSIPSEQADEVEQNPGRYREGERLRLPNPTVVPDEYLKPDRLAQAFWLAALDLAGQYPNAFRIDPRRLDATGMEGDESDRLAFWTRRAGVFADACRLTGQLLRQQAGPDDAGTAPPTGIDNPETERTAFSPYDVPICRQDRSGLEPGVAAAFDAVYEGLRQAMGVCESAHRLVRDTGSPGFWLDAINSFFASFKPLGESMRAARLALKPVHVRLTTAYLSLPGSTLPLEFTGGVGDCAHDVVAKIVGLVVSACTAQAGFLAVDSAARDDRATPRATVDARRAKQKWALIHPALARFATVDCHRLVTLMWAEAVRASGSQQDRDAGASQRNVEPATADREAKKKPGHGGVSRRRRSRGVIDRPLTKRQSEVFQLHMGEKLSVVEIAERLGISHPTVCQHLEAARRKMPSVVAKQANAAGKPRRLPADGRGQPNVVDDRRR